MLRSVVSTMAAAAVLMTAGAAFAQDKYKLDNPHTQIVFSVEHMGLSKSIGKFTDYDGEFAFDEKAPESSSVEVTIKTNSIDMSHDEWNEHLKGEKFLNVAQFPAMTFKSTSVKVTGDKTADVTGDLTLLGVTKPVVLKTTFNKAGPRPMGNDYAAGFSATTMIKRSDFGMTYGIPMVGDDIAIQIEVEGNKIGNDPTNQ